LLILVGQAAGFVLFSALVGSRAMRRYSVHLQRLRIENAPQARPLYQFLVPFFFVVTGAEANLAVFADLGVVVVAAVLTSLAVAGKLLGGRIGAWGARSHPPGH
jgi:hypothetical protein